MDKKQQLKDEMWNIYLACQIALTVCNSEYRDEQSMSDLVFTIKNMSEDIDTNALNKFIKNYRELLG